MTTTTVTYSTVALTTFLGLSDYGAATHPTAASMTAFIVRASAFVNSINDAAIVADHNNAVEDMCKNYHILAETFWRNAGATSGSGEGALTYSIGNLLSAEMKEMIERSGRKNSPEDSITVASFRA